MARFSRRQRVSLLLTIATLGLLLGRRIQKKRRRRRRQRPWVRRHLLNREKYGASAITIPCLIRNDPDRFITMVRLPIHIFEWLLLRVTPLIEKQTTCMRKAIPPRIRLYATLAFLSTGDSYRSLELLFLIGESTMGRFVPEVCDAIFSVLKDKYFKCPSTPAEWEAVANEFQRKWQLPNCMGALDGKHIRIMKPLNTGSNFFNYKSFFSVVLMALVDAQYRFLYVNVGANGRVSDGGVFRGTSLQKALQRGSSMFPPPRPCPGDTRPTSFYIVADDAFGLAENLMKPFSYRDQLYEHVIFNYRLSRGRRVVENGFGIFANRWRLFLRSIPLQPSTVERLVLAACAMHNLMRDTVGIPANQIEREARNGDLTQALWRDDEELLQAPLPAGTNVTTRARAQRNYLVRYFSSRSGAVSWQDAAVSK